MKFRTWIEADQPITTAYKPQPATTIYKPEVAPTVGGRFDTDALKGLEDIENAVNSISIMASHNEMDLKRIERKLGMPPSGWHPGGYSKSITKTEDLNQLRGLVGKIDTAVESISMKISGLKNNLNIKPTPLSPGEDDTDIGYEIPLPERPEPERPRPEPKTKPGFISRFKQWLGRPKETEGPMYGGLPYKQIADPIIKDALARHSKDEGRVIKDISQLTDEQQQVIMHKISEKYQQMMHAQRGLGLKRYDSFEQMNNEIKKVAAMNDDHKARISHIEMKTGVA